LIEGLFTDTKAGLAVDDESLEASLLPFVGRTVKVAVHHMKGDPGRWGGGSCYWQPSTACPCRHHLRPDAMLNFSAEGKLSHMSVGEWWVGSVRVPFDMIVMHSSRVIVVENWTPESSESVDPKTFEKILSGLPQ